MDDGGFYALLVWTGLMFGLGWFVGDSGMNSETAANCNKHNEVVIRGTVFQCKPVALVNQGVRAELK